jgi:uncharacterized protein YndB with AHSA1/START domain
MGRLMRAAVVEVVVDAPADAVWDVVRDPTRVGEWSHETHGAAWVDGATVARAGARFRGRNHTGRTRWSRVCEVLAVDPPHELTWRTVPAGIYRDSTEWRIRVEAVDGGTRITQTFVVLALSSIMDRLYWRFVPQHRDRRPALEADLRRLGEVAARRGAPAPA